MLLYIGMFNPMSKLNKVQIISIFFACEISSYIEIHLDRQLVEYHCTFIKKSFTLHNQIATKGVFRPFLFFKDSSCIKNIHPGPRGS